MYLSHNGLTEALGRRQVLPYLVGLGTCGWRVAILSFEKADTATPEAMARVEHITREAGIAWVPLRYHNRPPIMATVFDVLQGYRESGRLADSVQLLHARSTVPALIARLVSVRFGVPWVFDLRGLLAEEYVDAGHWPRGGVLHTVTATAEASLLRSADGVVALTRRALDRLPRGEAASGRSPTAVIPCSVDMESFHPSEGWRREVRADLGWGQEPVLVYAGSLGSWYRLEEMLDFFQAARQSLPDLRFLLLTPQAAMVEQALATRCLSGPATIRTLTPDAVPRYLAAADAGICFLGKHASKQASSPTKYGEYLAAGLPVVTNPWIGDAAALDGERAWLLVNSFDDGEYRRAAIRLAQVLKAPSTIRRASRQLAQREFALHVAVSRYDELYAEVLARWARERN